MSGDDAVRVECYAGGRGDEEPRRVVIGQLGRAVVEVLTRSVEEAAGDPGRTRRRFRVRLEDGAVVWLVHDVLDDRWQVAA